LIKELSKSFPEAVLSSSSTLEYIFGVGILEDMADDISGEMIYLFDIVDRAFKIQIKALGIKATMSELIYHEYIWETVDEIIIAIEKELAKY